MIKHFRIFTLMTMAFLSTQALEGVTNLTVTTPGDTAPTTGGAAGDFRFVLNTVNTSGPDVYNVSFNIGAPTITLGAMLPLLNLVDAANTLTIDGSNGGNQIIIDGNGNFYRGFFARQGNVNIQNMTVQNTRASGGQGGVNLGGGGMGAGGALFIDAATTTISNFSALNTSASGGTGAINAGSGPGGGGGMGGQGGVTFGGGGGIGGTGGNGIASGLGHGGGGGIGTGIGVASGNGGDGTGTAGTAGLGIGAASGGSGFAGGAGGANAGGGGGGAGNTGSGGGGGDGGNPGIINGNGGNGGYGGGGGADGGDGTFGVGGFGGGSGANGGIGGFGGGGGGGGGNGGFGGGASGDGGVAGSGGGNTTPLSTQGGGGMGAGGAIFVNSSAGSLVVTGPLIIANPEVFPGSGGFNGAAVGDDIFSTSGSPLFFNLGAATTVVIPGSIADDSIISLPAGQSYAPGTGFGESLIKQGLGVLELDGLNTYAGNTDVQQGRLILNGSIAGSGTVLLSGILSGTGFVGQNLFVAGTIIPGSESTIGTLTVGGSYTQVAGSTYRVQINGAGQSSLIEISSGANLTGGTVVVTTLDGQVSTTPYTILHAPEGVTGQYTGATATNITGKIPVLTYDPTHVFLSFVAAPIPPPPTPSGHFFVNNALTCNQLRVARQLDHITDPNAELSLILTTLAGLTPDQIRFGLDQLSAVSYANLLITAQQANSLFIRSLYNPLRDIITAPQCCCDPCCCCPCECMGGQPSRCGPLDVWFQASADKFHAKSDSNARGFTDTGYELSIGAQTTLDCDCRYTVGSAFAYSHENIDYNLCSRGRNNNFFGGLYGLFRPCDYYLLADFAFGYRTERVKRHIDIGDLHFKAHGRPKMFQGAFYGEFGVDWDLCSCSFLIQPFAGLELGYFRHGRICEHGAGPLNVGVKDHSRFSGISRLGVHFTARNISCFKFTADLAWDYYFTDVKNHIHERFQSFGDSFPIYGINRQRNSIDGALNVSTEFCDCWEVFATVSGQLWQKAYSYQVLGGVKVCW